MADYFEKNYVPFEKLEALHLHGFDSHKILEEVTQFIEDPAHVNYRFVDVIVTFLPKLEVSCVYTDDPPMNNYIEVTLLYVKG